MVHVWGESNGDRFVTRVELFYLDISRSETKRKLGYPVEYTEGLFKNTGDNVSS